MKKWDVKLSCKVVANYTVEAESAEEAEDIANEVFIVIPDYSGAQNTPEVVSYNDYCDYITEEVKEWTAS